MSSLAYMMDMLRPEQAVAWDRDVPEPGFIRQPLVISVDGCRVVSDGFRRYEWIDGDQPLGGSWSEITLRIADGGIEWFEERANRPTLRVTLVGRFPKIAEMRFRRVEVLSAHGDAATLWYAELGGAASYFSWRGPGNERGFGGTEYELTMEDGTSQVLLGPWSSGSYAMNAAGLGPVVEVTSREGHGGRWYEMRRALTVAFARAGIDRIQPTTFGPRAFPPGSRVELVPRKLETANDMFEPAVRLPDGELWTKPEL